jgi:histidinol-phosphatase
MEKAWRTRAHGDFWSHMLVAEGAVDIAAEPSLALWDMAALDIIVREAGGRFTNVEGVDGSLGGSGLSTNAALHDYVVSALKVSE